MRPFTVDQTHILTQIGHRLRAIEDRLKALEATPPPDEWFSVLELMRRERVSRRTVYNWMQKGKVEVRRTPSGYPRLRYLTVQASPQTSPPVV